MSVVRRFTRCVGVSLGFIAGMAVATEDPPNRWTQRSADGAFELVVERIPLQRIGGVPHLILGADLRLERLRPKRTVAWVRRSPALHYRAFVANDGDYVVMAYDGLRPEAITIRNSAGAVIRSLSEHDLISIPEALEGTGWRALGLDSIEEHLLVEITRAAGTARRATAIGRRRIQLMDGAVIDLPIAPTGFSLPPFPCPPPRVLEVRAQRGELVQVCTLDEGSMARGYWAYDRGRFELVEAMTVGDGADRRVWTAAEHEGLREPCVSTYEGQSRVSLRCGLGVQPW